MKKLLLVLAVATVMASCKGKDHELQLGDTMPAFVLNDTLSSAQFKGKFTLVAFFATWCPGCKAELPYIQHFYTKYKDSQQIVFVPIAREQTEEDIEKLWKANNFSMPAYPDPERKVYSLFASKTIPRVYLFTPTGILLYKTEGFSTDQIDNLTEILSSNIVLAQ